MTNIKKMFELLNRINHTPSESDFKLDAKIKHAERINTVLRSVN